MGRGSESVTDRAFIAFDGEGKNDRYVLLASSDGQEVYQSSGLTRDQCLAFLTRKELSKTINVWFAFGYDFTMILKDVLDRSFWAGERVAEWHGWKIKYIARKIVEFKNRKITIRHYDMHGFFQSSFEQAIKSWLNVTDETISKGKRGRANFAAWKAKEIKEYNRLELVYLVQLAEKVRSLFWSLPEPVTLKSWHGAGACANAALSLWKIREEIGETVYPLELDRLSLKAYYGGRIELIKRGTYQPVYHADLRSAYPSAMLTLPDLSKSLWSKVNDYKGLPGVYHVRWESQHSLIGCFPFRRHDGSIVFPLTGRGWYYHHEVQAALDAGNDLEITEGYAITDFVPSRLSVKVQEWYNLRNEYKRLKDGREKAVKLALNSIYGKFAQRPTGGYGGYRSLILAGWITSHARAKLYAAGIQHEGQVIAFSTDGLYSTVQHDLDCGDQLGQWDAETVKRMTFIQSGFYVINGETYEVRTRGFLSDEVNFNTLIHTLNQGKSYKIACRRFITVPAYLHSPYQFKKPGTWQTVSKQISPESDRKRFWGGLWGKPNYKTSIPATGERGESQEYTVKTNEDEIDLLLLN